MSEFTVPLDIKNRACQHVGVPRLASEAEISRAASEINFVYGKLRRAELQRNLWTFATRWAVLRPVNTDTMLLAAALWSSATTYFVGSIVEDSNGNLWISTQPDNLNFEPITTPAWEPYFGPLTVSLYDADTAYYAGELVYTAAGDGTNRVFLSLENGNDDDPAVATEYDATVTYRKNQVVTSASIAYMSLLDLNTGNTPVSSPAAWTALFVGGTGSIKWLQIGGVEFPAGVTLSTPNIIYPFGAGPASQVSTRNIYRLPGNYLRTAPQDPKAGSTSFLGAPSERAYDDWNYERGYLVTRQGDPIAFRFIADVADVRLMHDMFCEGLGARIGFEVCEPITQSGGKKGLIAQTYQKFMSEARLVNAIEVGSIEPPLDDYIAARA